MKYISIIIIVNSLLSTDLFAQGFRLTVSGSPTFYTSTLAVLDAGNDFDNKTIQSTSTTSLIINNSNLLSPKSFRISANLVSPIERKISIYRTGAVTGLYSLLKQDYTPTELTTNPRVLFDGISFKYPTTIPIGFSVENISVINPVKNISVSILFTVTDR